MSVGARGVFPWSLETPGGGGSGSQEQGEEEE